MKDHPAVIYLTNGRQCLVDRDLHKYLSRYNWHPLKTKWGAYAQARVNGSKKLMHRIIMKAKDGECVDHINGKKLDNRKSNLRICSQSENNFNRSGIAGFKGVYFCKRNEKWKSYIKVGRCFYHLGYFDDEIGAAWAYDMAAYFFVREFAKFNFGELNV